jgi:hypothetical protein
MKTSNKFTPIIIGYKSEDEKTYQTNLEAKKNALEELFSYIGKFITTEDRKTFRANLYDTFVQRFYDKYANNYPHITINKMFGLLDVDIQRINSLISKISSIDIDENAAAPDFNIYTENEEQNKLYGYLKTIIENIENLQKSGFTIYPAPLINAFNSALHYDFKDNRLKPSIHFVKGKPLRF